MPNSGGYGRSWVRANALQHIIDIVAFDTTLFVISQVHFCIGLFQLVQIGKGLGKCSRRAVSHSGSATQTSHSALMLGEINGFSIRCIVDIWPIRGIWLVRGPRRSQSILRWLSELVQGLRTFPLFADFERALQSWPSRWTTGSFLLLIGMKLNFYNDLMMRLNFESYSLQILPETWFLKWWFQTYLGIFE